MGVGAYQAKGPRVVRALLVLAALGFLAWRLRQDGSGLAGLHPSAPWLALAVVATMLALAGQVAAWRWNLAQLGARARYGSLFRVYYLTNLARYVPGKVWSLIGMVACGRRLGIHPGIMSASVFLGLTSSLISGLCVGCLAAFAVGEEQLFSAGLIIVPLCAWALMWPPVFRAWAGWLLRRLGMSVVLPSLSGALLARSFLHYALVWCAYACAVGALGESVQAESFGLYFAVFPLAYLAGYAALFAPGGWGVREGTLVLLAGGGPVALAVSLLQRVLLTVFEFGLFGYALWSWRHD
jgi:uncharacterized membrane protein YbhN (UPF0104 family)